jgi:hypothetical protein
MYSFDELTVHTVLCLQWSVLLKCAARKITDFTFSSNICNRRQEENTAYLGKFCVYFVNYLMFMYVTSFCRTVTNLCFFFRSRSYPVPHRGERVKQRTMQPEIELIITLTAKFSAPCRNTNKMQLSNRIYYSKVFKRLNMFRAAHRL